MGIGAVAYNWKRADNQIFLVSKLLDSGHLKAGAERSSIEDSDRRGRPVCTAASGAVPPRRAPGGSRPRVCRPRGPCPRRSA